MDKTSDVVFYSSNRHFVKIKNRWTTLPDEGFKTFADVYKNRLFITYGFLRYCVYTTTDNFGHHFIHLGQYSLGDATHGT